MIKSIISRGKLKFEVRENTLDEWIVDEVRGGYSYLKPLNIVAGDKVLDIGLNIGVFAVTAAMKGAEVVGYEPDIENFKQAKVNIDLNGLKCDIRNYGISDKNKIVDFYLNEKKNRGNHSTTKFRGRRCVAVEMSGINEVLKEGFNKIKIDCEGEEFKIIMAINDFSSIDAIRMEWHRRILKDEGNELFSEMINRLEGNGFMVIAKRDGKGWTQMVTAIKKEYMVNYIVKVK